MMVDFGRNSKKRGYSLKMKLLARPNGRNNEKLVSFSSFNRYFKWLLWFSLSFYFFSSYLISNDPATTTTIIPPSKTAIFSASLALFEKSINTTISKSRDEGPRGSDLKVYVYDLPSKYNRDWFSNDRCRTHLFAAEVAIHEALLASDEFRTLDPWEADFFFVPVYVSCNFSTANGFPAIGHARRLLASAVQLISSDMPFWNRSDGSDHVFVATHDFGACFHTMEDAAIADGIPAFLKKSIILQTFGVRFRHPCQDVEHVVIPPYVSPESLQKTLEKAPKDGRRDIWVFFRGKMEVHPKNVSGRFYSRRVRTEIWHRFNGNRKFYIKRNRFAGYQSEIVRSVFCLCPLGWAPWSPRLVESVALGCVPIIIADGIRLPFPSSVPWQNISLIVPERRVSSLPRILEHVASTNLSSIRAHLLDPSVRQALLFNRRVQDGDATWQVLDALSRRLHRSHGRSRLRGKSGFDTWR